MHRVQVTQLFANHLRFVSYTISYVERVSALRSSQVESRQTRQKGLQFLRRRRQQREASIQSSNHHDENQANAMPCHNIMPLTVISSGMIAAHSNLFPLLFVMAQPSSSSSSTTATPGPTESLQTLAPFALTVSGPPTSPSISSSLATTPTVSPTDGPTSLPSYSKFPTVVPSVSPTAYPTISSHPTALPSTSFLPTLAASDYPSISPVYAPSSTPSTETYVSVHRSFQQILQVEAAEVFTDVQHKIYQLLMQSYTANFGHMVSEPLIVTTAIITDQSLAAGRRKRRNGRRRRRLNQQQQRTSSRIRQLLFENATEGGILSSSSTNTSDLNLPHLLRQFEPIPIHLLVISFTMKYTTKFGFDNMEEYPAQFQNYINSNLANVTVDMSMRFLPVLEARSVLMYLPVSTGVPSPNPSSLSPQYYWNGGGQQPTEQPPSVLVPTTMAPYPSSSPIIKEKANFVVGLAVGLVLAAIVVGVFIGYKIIKNRRKQQQQQQQPIADEEMRRDFRDKGNESLERNSSWRIEEGVEVRAEDVMPLPGETEEMTSTPSGGKSSSDPFVTSNEQQQYHHHHHQQQQQQQSQLQIQSPQQHFVENGILLESSIINNNNNNNDALSTQTFIPHDAIADSMLSNPSMVSGGGSFSSNPDDYPDGMFGGGGGGGIGSQDVRVDTLQDEFDNYKNHDLEYMRSGVEETVYGAESMMSLAMTRALMGEEDVDAHPSWVEAEGDPESMEANGLCETNDWLRKNEHSTLDERNQFFQELLNRMVITVRRGLLSPANGTLTIHCCAAMLGLQLEKELPNNVLLVHGMRKANDLALGRVYLIEAFNTFGEIESAAIAPSNRGFGFVRFVSPKSVQRALEQFRISEIEVQDVSVMIKSLNDFSPAYD